MAKKKVQCMKCGKEFWSRVNKVFVIKAAKKFVSCPKCGRLFGINELKLFEGLDINQISGIEVGKKIESKDIKCPVCNVRLETKREPLRQRILGTSMNYKGTLKFKALSDEELFVKKTLVPKDQLCKVCANEEENIMNRMRSREMKEKNLPSEEKDVSIRVLSPAEAVRNIRKEVNGKIILDLREKQKQEQKAEEKKRREEISARKREEAMKRVEMIKKQNESVIVAEPKKK